MSILTLTMNPTIDISTSADEVLPEKKLRCDKPQRDPGGGGINVSRAIYRLGGKSVACYAYGDAPGDHLNQLLEREGIERLPIKIEDSTRESIAIIDRKENSQYRFVMPGPEFTEEEWSGVLKKIENLEKKPNFIVASGSLPESVPDDFYAQLVKLGHKLDINIILDTSGKPLRLALKEEPFLIKPNIREFNTLIDRDIENADEIIEAGLELLRDCRCRAIVVSLEGDGAVLISGDKAFQYRIPEVEVKSKIGAGDSMVAGLTHYLELGKEIRDAVRYGAAAGTAAVLTPGTELCRKEDADRLYEQIEVREYNGSK